MLEVQGREDDALRRLLMSEWVLRVALAVQVCEGECDAIEDVGVAVIASGELERGEYAMRGSGEGRVGEAKAGHIGTQHGSALAREQLANAHPVEARRLGEEACETLRRGSEAGTLEPTHALPRAAIELAHRLCGLVTD